MAGFKTVHESIANKPMANADVYLHLNAEVVSRDTLSIFCGFITDLSWPPIWI